MQNSSFHLESFPFTAFHGSWDLSITLSHCIGLWCMSLCWRVSKPCIHAIGVQSVGVVPYFCHVGLSYWTKSLSSNTFTYSAFSPAPTAFFISQNYLVYVLYITYKDFSYISLFHMEFTMSLFLMKKKQTIILTVITLSLIEEFYFPIPKMGYNLLHKVFQYSLLNTYFFKFFYQCNYFLLFLKNWL